MKLSFNSYFILKRLPKVGNIKALKIAKKLSSDIESAQSPLMNINKLKLLKKICQILSYLILILHLIALKEKKRFLKKRIFKWWF